MNETIRSTCRQIAEQAHKLDKLLAGNGRLPDLTAAELLVALDKIADKLHKFAGIAEADIGQASGR